MMMMMMMMMTMTMTMIKRTIKKTTSIPTIKGWEPIFFLSKCLVIPKNATDSVYMIFHVKKTFGVL